MILTIALLTFVIPLVLVIRNSTEILHELKGKKNLSIFSYVEGKRLRIVNDIIFFLSQLNIAFR